MRIFSTKKDSEQGQPAAAPVEPVEKPVIANQSAFLVWQSPNCSGPKLIGSALKLGDSHASVRNFLGMTLRQHRTMGAAGFSGSFAPIVQYEKWEIHSVFPHFPYFRLCQNLSPNLLAPLCGATLTFLTHWNRGSTAAPVIYSSFSENRVWASAFSSSSDVRSGELSCPEGVPFPPFSSL